MTTLIGLSQAQALLSSYPVLPHVLLLEGLPGTGRAELLAEQGRLRQISVHTVERLDVGAASLVSQMCVYLSFHSRAFLIDVDRSNSSEVAVNALLKLFEAPPPKTFFFLYATPNGALDTVRSRATVIGSGALSTQQVYEVLVSLGMDAYEAKVCAVLSNGSVAQGLSWAGAASARGSVRTLLNAAVNRDHDLMENALRSAGELVARLLAVWAREARMGRYEVFDVSDTASFTTADFDKVERVLMSCDHPKLGVRAALSQLM